MHKHNKGDLQARRIPYLIFAQHERKHRVAKSRQKEQAKENKNRIKISIPRVPR